jgi:hypothetical protein
MKTILVMGCSFSAEENNTWISFLKNKYKLNILNKSISGIGNHLIAHNTILECQQLIKEYSDIFVIIQWSGLFRYDQIVHKTKADHRILYNNDTEYVWMDSFAFRENSFWKKYYEIKSYEQAFLETIENILRVQWFLKSNNILYKMLNGWDILTYGEIKPLRDFGINEYGIADEININGSQYLNDNYESINNNLIIDKFKWVKPLWDLIDWDNYWTYNDDKIKYGGIIQWVKRNLPKEIWHPHDGDFHPHQKAHELFADYAIKNIFPEIYEKN